VTIAGRLLGKQILNLGLFKINHLKITIFINNTYIYYITTNNNRSFTVTGYKKRGVGESKLNIVYS
jgi:hypothetical protein